MFRHYRALSSRTRLISMAALMATTVAVGTLPAVTNATAASKETITVWNDPLAAGSVGVPASKSFLTKGVQLFEAQNPNINVKILQEPFDSSSQFSTLLSAAELAGTTPDIGQLYVGGQVLQNAKFLVPLNSVLPKSYVNSLTGWQFVSKNFQLGSTIYAVPYGDGYYYTVYYNKADFAKAGITTLPTSWTQLTADAAKLKAKGITPFEFGEKEGYFGAWVQDAMMSGLGGNEGVLAMYNGKQSLNSPLLTKPYAAWHGLYASGFTNKNAPTLTYTSGIANFAAGQAAMTITGQYYDSQIAKGLGSNVGLFPVPALPGAKYPKALSGGPNNSYVIFKTSKHVADAAKLVEFLTSLRVQLLSVNELGQLPNNKSFAVTPAFAKSQPLLNDLSTYINTDHYALDEAFDNVMPGSVSNYWYQSNNGVFAGSLSPASAAASMQSQMQSYLATAATS